MKNKLFRLLPAALAIAISCGTTTHAAEKIKALIVDGQNNHKVWPKSTIMMKQYLEETGLFEVKVERTKFLWSSEREKAFLPLAKAGKGVEKKEPQADPDFSPDFSQYDVVVSNFGFKAADWPEQTRKNFEKYMTEGGGLVAVHAANNAWAQWPEFNRMIGLGGWGGRDKDSGPYVYINNEGEVVRDDGPGKCGAHGPRAEFVVTMRVKDHPITEGIPDFWMQGTDECYSLLRGPAENMKILATAADTPKLQKEGRNEPMLMVIDYHEGRVFHTTLGHDTPAFESVGFINTFTRGTEWAATGKVTIPVAEDFPGPEKAVLRPFKVEAK